MPDEPSYDPDRTLWADVDFSELSDEDVLALTDSYLSNPVSKALADDLGRQFRSRPPQEQLPQLMRELERCQEQRRDIRQALANCTNELRPGLERLAEAVENFASQIENRVRELEAET